MVVRFGVLGCADVAWRRTLPAMCAEPSVEFVAIAGRSAAKAEAFAARFGGTAARDHAELLTRPDIDAVYLSLPTGLHREWVERAVHTGKHVLVEKPMATSAADVRAVHALALASGRQVMDNYMFVHHSQHAEVAARVAGGDIGQVRRFSGDFGIPPLPATDFRYRPDLGGGALLDLGGYPLRAALLHLGPGLRVVGAVSTRSPGHGVDVAGSVLLVSARGVTAELTFGFVHAYRSEYALWGSAGELVLHRAFTPPPEHRPTLTWQRDGQRHEVRLPADDQFAASLRYFAAAVRSGAGPGPWWPETLAHAALLDDIRARATVVLEDATNRNAMAGTLREIS